MSMNYQTLKARHRAERGSYHQNLSLRVHRALSWLDRAEQLHDDADGRFIFLWISFNAAYASDIDERYRLSEQATFRSFLKKLLELDGKGRFEQLVWAEFSGSIRLLLDNPFVFYDFWSHQKGEITEVEWKKRFSEATAAVKAALSRRDTEMILSVVLSRIYTLRNQLMHGGATWNGSVNRDQMRDCVNLMGKLAPLTIEVMLDNPKTLWGDACFPVVK
jgi:Apea-like HEPN